MTFYGWWRSACDRTLAWPPRISFCASSWGLYLERHVKPRRVDSATRITLVVLARLIEWRCVLTVVQPATLVRWQRQGFRLFWRWKSRRCGRPRTPQNLQQLIAEMATANRTWGKERIAAAAKQGISVSPRTVRRYMPQRFRSHHRPRGQSWSMVFD